MSATLTSNQFDESRIIPTQKPRIVPELQPQNETNKGFNTPTKSTTQ